MTITPLARQLAVGGLCLLLAGLSACGDSRPLGPAGAGLTPIVPAAVAFAPTADPDPFYNPVLADPTLPPGTLLDSRPITFQVELFPFPNPAWHIKFVTTNGQGRPMVGVATVVRPLVPAPGGPRAVGYQAPYNSLGARCVLSHLSGMRDSIQPTPGQSSSFFNYFTGMTALGWTMIFPDFEGPYHAYAAGPLTGRVTLDALRAALAFEPLGLSATTPLGLWGYSGGAIATAWAAAQHQSYAPELNLVGAVSGGTPADLLSVFRAADNTTFFPLIFTAMMGVNREYPAFFEGHLNAQGLEAAKALRDACQGTAQDGTEATGSIQQYVNTPNFLNAPHLQALEQTLSLPQGGGTPRFPVFVHHEVLDQLIPIAGADRLVEAWCAQGTPVTYLRGLNGEHAVGGFTRFVEGTNFLESQFSGVPFVAAPTAQRCNQPE